MSYIIIPKVLELIQRLPIVAKSGRESELRSDFNLVSGYLSLAFGLFDESSGDSRQKSSLSKRRKKDFGTFLSNKILEDPVRKCLAGSRFYLTRFHALATTLSDLFTHC